MNKFVTSFIIFITMAVGVLYAHGELSVAPSSFAVHQNEISNSMSQSSTASVLAETQITPNAGTPESKLPELPIAPVVSPDHKNPVELIIPSINLDSPIQSLGLNKLGEMDVPDGRTNNVGWYEYGTIP